MAQDKTRFISGLLVTPFGTGVGLGPDTDDVADTRQVGAAVTQNISPGAVTGDMAATEASDIFAAESHFVADMAATEASDTFSGDVSKVNLNPVWINSGGRGDNSNSTTLVLNLPAGFDREGEDYVPLGGYETAPGGNGHDYGGLEPFGGWTPRSNITPGNLLIAALYRRFSTSNSDFVVTWPDGWTEINTYVTNKNSGGTPAYICVSYAYRIADGATDGTSITITVNQQSYFYGHIEQYTGNIPTADAIGVHSQHSTFLTNGATASIDGITSTTDGSTAWVSIFGNNMTFNSATSYFASGTYNNLFAATNMLTADDEFLGAAGDTSATTTIALSPSQEWSTFTLEIRSVGLVPEGDLDVTEARDTFAATGTVPIIATMAANEPVDVFAATGTVPFHSTLAATEASDIFLAVGSDAVFVGPGRRAFAVINH